MDTKTTKAKKQNVDDFTLYNNACKLILSQKQIFAHILKGSVALFNGCEVSRIETLIDGHQTSGGRFIGKDTVSVGTDKNDMVAFDLLNIVQMPNSKDCMYINIEAQKNFYPGYDIFNRAEYYVDRMLTRQYGVEFTHSQYNKLKQCKSIWICYNAPKHRQNSIYRYPRTAVHVEGKKINHKKKYNLTEIIMICLGEYEKGQTGLLGLLNLIFSTTQTKENKIKILKEEFKIQVTEEMDRRLDDMCNVAEGIAERHERKGFRRGVKKGDKQGFERGDTHGFTRGVTNTQINNIKNVMDTLSVSLNQAMDILKIPLADRKKYASMLN